MNVKRTHLLNPGLFGSATATAPRQRGVAIVLVIIAVAAAAVIGSAYVASQLNAPQVVGNVNAGIKARYLADSGADLASAIMECKTIDWRTVQVNGVLVDSLPVGDGAISIRVADPEGGVPDATCEYPIVVAKGASGDMRQFVGTQLHTPLAEELKTRADVDLGEFAVFGNAGISLTSGWITYWGASPLCDLGSPVNVGTNATTRAALTIASRSNAPDSVAYVMRSAVNGTILDAAQASRPVPRKEFSLNETVLLPGPPKPDFSKLLWATSKTASITSNTSLTVNSDRRYSSITVDSRATLKIDLAGGHRTIGIGGKNLLLVDVPGGLTIQNEGVLEVSNGELDIVVTGAFNMFNRGALVVNPDSKVRLFLGGTMSIDDSVVGLPVSVRDGTRDARKGLDRYFDPALCRIYRLNSITSLDLNLLDLDTAADWIWSDNTVKSWIVNNKSYVCASIYGHSKVSFSLDNRSAIFGNLIANNVVISTESAIYYDHALNGGFGYTNPSSGLYAAPLDLRDDVRLLLTDLSDGTISALLALLTVAPSPTPFDPFGPTPREKARVAQRWWKHYGVKVKRDRQSSADTVIASQSK